MFILLFKDIGHLYLLIYKDFEPFNLKHFLNASISMEDWTVNENDSMLHDTSIIIQETGLPECRSTPFIDTAISLSNLFAVINSAANFLIYMLRGKKFRDLFVKTYFRKSSCLSLGGYSCRQDDQGISQIFKYSEVISK